MLVDSAHLFLFYSLFLFVVFLFVIEHFFESEEILTGLLIQLLVNITIDTNKFGNNHML